jgi:iron complex transport system substrate-binding protein
MNRSALRSLLVAAALVVTAAACGSDDPSNSDTDAAASAATTPEPTDAAAPAGTGPTDTSEPTGTEVDAAAFPVTIEHKFGSTTVETEPQRVVSIGYNEHDFLLALGVVPVALRDWYGEQPNSVWPWAQDELGGATPEVLPATDLNFEQIAALEPDLIVGVWSGMTAEDYQLLSAIAPTVAQPDAYDDYGTPWQEQTMILGAATGRTAQAEAVVADVEGQIVAAREAHPEWQGQTSSVAFVTEEGPGAYASQDTRSRFMQDLGFVIPAVNDTDETNSFYMQLSAEDITALDVDVLVWVIGTAEALDGILDQLPTRPSLTAYAEGREIFADIELSGAFSHSSPLSLEYVLDLMVPEIEAAADGDPATPVPSAVAVGAVSADGASGATDDPAEPAGVARSPR